MDVIKCVQGCDDVRVDNVVQLLSHRDDHGLFKCSKRHDAYVEKSFALQEKGQRWEPFLRGAISLGEPGDTYQPFVYLVSDAPAGKIDDLWFAYYKDTWPTGGHLKIGYGPGGPPVLSTGQVRTLLAKVDDLGDLLASLPRKQLSK